MNLSEKIGQRLMVGIRGTTLDGETRNLLQEIKPGSIILFRRNIKSAAQVKRLIVELKNLLPSPPLIAIDQEGGLVVRFTSGLCLFPGNMALGATGSYDLAFQQGLVSGRELKNIGIDINLSPVIDVITTYHNPGITIRSFGDDPLEVSRLGSALIMGMQKMKVAAAAKHFPGKGAAEVDAHLDLPVITISRQTFEEIHLLPFRKVIETGVKGIMTTHIYCPSLAGQEKRPATFSPEIINHYLRKKLHFPGIIFSDDLEMGAIARYYSIGETCIKGILAGHDFLLICSDYQKQREGFNALQDAFQSSLLSMEELEISVKRIKSLKEFCREEPPKTSLPEEFQSPAGKIADRSITLFGDKMGLIPIKNEKEKRILLIMPDLSILDGIEEGYSEPEEHFLKKEVKKYFPGKVVDYFIPIEIKPTDIKKVLGLLSKEDTVIALIFDAQTNAGQRHLLEGLQKKGASVILAFIRNPFDIEFLSPIDTCLITYGFRKLQLSSLIKIIFGKLTAKGHLPFQEKNET